MWKVVGGELAVVDPKDNSDLVSERTFQDLKLHLEFNVDPKSNSGVYPRGRRRSGWPGSRVRSWRRPTASNATSST